MIIYPKVLEEGKPVFINPLDTDKLWENKRNFLLAWLKVKPKEFADGFTNESQIAVLHWLASDKREIDLPYSRQPTDKKYTEQEFRKLPYDHTKNFDLFCENDIFSFEEFLVADGETIHDLASLEINLGGESDNPIDFWCEGTRLRDLVIFEYIDSEGLMSFIKRIGWDISPTTIYKNRYTGKESPLKVDGGADSSYCAWEQERLGSFDAWIGEHFNTFFENNCPKSLWTKKQYREPDEPTQSKLFDIPAHIPSQIPAEIPADLGEDSFEEEDEELDENEVEELCEHTRKNLERIEAESSEQSILLGELVQK